MVVPSLDAVDLRFPILPHPSVMHFQSAQFGEGPADSESSGTWVSVSLCLLVDLLLPGLELLVRRHALLVMTAFTESETCSGSATSVVQPE